MHKKRKPRDPFPYDSVFRTMVTDCRRLLILAINCFLDEHHPLDSKVWLFPDTFILHQQDGRTVRRITDANFRIEERHFLFECQSTKDRSMPSRFFEYGAQIALQNGEIRDNNLDVFFPKCILLHLRSDENTPDKLQIQIHVETTQIPFDVTVVKIQDYSLETLFENHLYFLLPFFLFNRESALAECNKNEENLQVLIGEFVRLKERLDADAQLGLVTAYEKRTIEEMSIRVAEGLAAKYQNVLEGVRLVMGGTILEYEAKTIFREGEAQGETRGKAIGTKNGQKEMAKYLLAKGVDPQIIAESSVLSLSEVEELAKSITA